MSHGYDYDYVVIGGGSGGMASSKEAARLGAKVALFDFVKPSPQGTKWGLGGTCVNVGCVPKKLMHYAGLLGAGMYDAQQLGWKIGEPQHDWGTLVKAVQGHVKSLNFGYRTGLRSAKVTYLNHLARFADPHTVEYTMPNGDVKTVTADRFCIAVGGRPIIPDDVPGAREFAITSDDIFSLKNAPGQTLVVGASYIALECAGFLHELGYDVTVAVRSIVLRGFDRQCSEKVASLMADLGVQFLYGPLPTQIVRGGDGRLNVTFSDGHSATYDTVLYATGRYADTEGLALDKARVEVGKNGKLRAVNETTNVPHIHVVGDIIEGRPELTPVAIRAGELLARRLFDHQQELMNYSDVPTTVFTPFEYGCVGVTEEEAIAQHGEQHIETYLFEFTSLELAAVHRKKAVARRADEFDDALPQPCLSKLVCLKPEKERVIGFHFVGPNAGEVTQGFALAVLLGATKKDFSRVIGIHPTDAEAFTAMDITRASGQPFAAAGGCGGGKCG